MREIYIDLSSDNHLQQPKIFGGYAGEHNETVLQVKLPKRMVDIECSGYRFDFQTSEDNIISSPLIPASELKYDTKSTQALDFNDILSFYLTEQLTVAGKLIFKIAAILSDETGVFLVSKTNTVVLCIEDSPNGNIQLIDPNGYKDELLKMVDARILEINPVAVDQTYNPESEKAQSGKAVSEAINVIAADTATLKETTETLTADTESLKETAETLTADIENLKHRVNVDASDGLEGRINRILRELYFDFSSAEADYTASYIDRIRIGRNVNGRWFVEFGKASYQETLITFSEDSERYDVITAQNADGVKAYAVIDWSELPEGGATIYSMLSLNSVDEIGAWPAIYAYINGEKIKETISGGGTGEDGISPIVDIIEIKNGHRVEITDAYGAKAFDVLNGKDGVGITKIEYLTNTENSDVYAIYFTDGTYTPINIPKGKNGADGYTPQKGSDYFTEADKAEMVAAVISALPKYEGEVEAV